jgi:hypothetical protein
MVTGLAFWFGIARAVVVRADVGVERLNSVRYSLGS